MRIKISLEVRFPGMTHPVFIEGMSLVVDRDLYSRYIELGELDGWLQWQAVDYVMKHSQVRSVATQVDF